MTRVPYLAAGGACAILVMIIAVELSVGLSDLSGSQGDTLTGADGAGTEDPVAANLDKLAKDILDRPLFSADRHAPASPETAQDTPETPTAKTAPELRGRLAGVTIGPDDRREAVFAREGEKPLSVKEGDDVDGWTVSSIESGRVVLNSEFGEKVVTPTFGAPTGVPTHGRPGSVAKQVAGAEPPIEPQAAAIPANRRVPPGRGFSPAPPSQMQGAPGMAHRPTPPSAARRRDSN